MKEIPQTRLLKTAEKLFLEKGFQATGINHILAEARVAKQTLYNHFSSKDGLIEIILRLKSKKVMNWLQNETRQREAEGSKPLEALFETLGAWFEEKDFSGCIFARAALEFPDPRHPAHKIAAAHTAKVFAFLNELCAKTATPLPAPGEHLLLLFEGATSVSAKTRARKASAKRALTAAETLFKG